MTISVGRPDSRPAGLLTGVPVAVLAVAMVLAVLVALLLHHSGWARQEVLVGLAAYALLASVVASIAIRHSAAARFGLANQTTLLRAGLVCLMCGPLLGAGGALDAGWPLIGLAGAALALDAVDGWLARRLRLASRFGARFDVEVDTLLLLTLALLVWQSGRAGPWVLAIGLMRYAFLLAARAMPTLRRPLPPSLRRRTVFGVQALLLIACLLPPIPAAHASWLAASALLALAASFARDVRWLLGAGRALGAPSASGA